MAEYIETCNFCGKESEELKEVFSVTDNQDFEMFLRICPDCDPAKEGDA